MDSFSKKDFSFIIFLLLFLDVDPVNKHRRYNHVEKANNGEKKQKKIAKRVIDIIIFPICIQLNLLVLTLLWLLYTALKDEPYFSHNILLPLQILLLFFWSNVCLNILNDFFD